MSVTSGSDPKLKRRVARRLILYILLFSSIITFLGTSLQLYLDYSKDVTLIEQSMEQMESSYLPSIINSLWVSDHAQLKTLLSGMLQLPDMQNLEIVQDGEEIISVGSPASQNIITRTFPLSYNYRGEDIHLGDLMVYASLTGVYNRLLDKVLVILGTQAVKTFLVSTFIFIIFYLLIGKHLETMADYARSFNINNLESSLTLQRRSKKSVEKDELDQLVVSINQMRLNLKNSYDDLRYAKERLETEIAEKISAEEDRARLVMAVENVIEAIIITDPAGTILYVNPAFEKISGYSSSEALGEKLKPFMSQEGGGKFYDDIWRSVSKGAPWMGRFSNTKKNGARFVEDATISPIVDSGGKTVNCVVIRRDVTKEEMYEKRFHQARKMEAIGTLAGGIAHDFNNILSPIIGYTQLLLRSKEEGNPDKELLEEVLMASKMAKDLIKQILTFSRIPDGELRLINPYIVVNEVVRLIRSSLPSDIEVQTSVSKECGMIKSYPTHVSQLVLNLCSNAGQIMMEKGGKLSLVLEPCEITDSFEIEKSVFQVGVLNPGRYIKLSVSDTGSGMKREVMERIFEPFFTTKAVGEGTGMGLAIVHGIVIKHGGSMTVTSEPGCGSTFEVYLPIADGQAQEAQTDELIVKGNERILYIEDEIHVAKSVVRMLEELGYKVDAHSDGQSAIKILKDNLDEYDLVLTDQTMPGIKGDELTKLALEIRPDIPVIIYSGYSPAFNYEMAKAIGAKDFILKPLILPELSASLRRALDTA